MKPIITKQEAVTTYTITLTEESMEALMSAVLNAPGQAACDIWNALHAAKKEADGE
jgi:hypothetical protein